MEIAPLVPAWLTWMVAGAVGVLALLVFVRGIEAMLELDLG